MLPLGITQVNNIIVEAERQQIKNEILSSFNTKKLNDESSDNHYKNSYGGEVKFDYIYDRLTKVVENITGLKLEKANSYSRIYFNDSVLKSHVDRQGLDLTLSVQIENTFDVDVECPIYTKGYDNTIYETKLNNSDGVLVKGTELEHWRNPMVNNTSGYLMCIFFHWTIVQVQYQEVNNFLDKQECSDIIELANKNTFTASSVLEDYAGSKVDVHARSSVSMNWNSNTEELNKKLIPYFGNLKLETWQLLKYEKDNQFSPHYDNGGSIDKRIFTAMIYLNDDFKGGTTTFNNENIILKPETGKLVIWKNLNNKIIDPKSMHSGDKIEEGIKYVLVSWINLPN